jgi:hypothetical protein
VFDDHSSRVDVTISDKSPVGRSTHADPLADALLTTLGQFDLEHERELERIRLGSSSEGVKNRVLRRLHEAHRARREPYLKQLARIGRHPAATPQTAIAPRTSSFEPHRRT